jgi:hypothetical protein
MISTLRGLPLALLTIGVAAVTVGCTGYVRVHGHLRDKNGNPVTGAKIAVWLGLDWDKHTVSASDGGYSASVVSAMAKPMGKPGMEILHPDYERELIYFNLKTDYIGDLTKDVVMTKKTNGTVCFMPFEEGRQYQGKQGSHPTNQLQVQLDGNPPTPLFSQPPTVVRGLSIRDDHSLLIRNGSDVIQELSFSFSSSKTSKLCLVYVRGLGEWALWDSYQINECGAPCN